MSSESDDSECEEYEVEAIRAWRYLKNEKQREFLIKWRNYDESENTWEPEDYLNCPDAIDEFKATLTKRERKWLESKEPEKLSGFQRNAVYMKCVGADGPHDSDDEDSPKREKQPFYVLILFDDAKQPEDITLKEFFENKPDEAFEFCEQRLLRRELVE